LSDKTELREQSFALSLYRSTALPLYRSTAQPHF